MFLPERSLHFRPEAYHDMGTVSLSTPTTSDEREVTSTIAADELPNYGIVSKK